MLDKMQAVFREVFQSPTLTITEQTTPEHIEGWDSLGHIRLVLALESAFGVEFKAGEVGSVENVGGLIALLESKLGVESPRKLIKVVVTDLDNTLWTGVVGEDEITVSQEQAQLQQYLAHLRRRGVLLAVCSRNNEDDALRILENHSGMLIRGDYFNWLSINWENKAENIKVMASVFNLGLDSFLFLDDSPAERELVRSMLPEVTIPEWEGNPLPILQSYFDDSTPVTSEDRNRSQMYAEEFQREKFKSRAKTYEEYLKGLELRIQVEEAKPEDIDRIHQLIQKTNQFNLTSMRYTYEAVRRFISYTPYLLYVLRCSDKFGDYGLVGVALAERFGSLSRLTALLLSCRVLGRRVEDVFFARLLGELRRLGANSVLAYYRPTEKNGLVKNFYSSQGMEYSGSHSSDSELGEWDLYTMRLDSYQPPQFPWLSE